MTRPAPDLSPPEAAALLASDAAYLLDVREDDEWAAGHAKGANHLPLGALDPRAVPTDRPVIAVCRSGGRSGKAAELLAAAGHDVHNMSGGMKAWATHGLPVVGADGSAGTVI